MLFVRKKIYTLQFLLLLISHALSFSSPYPRPNEGYYSQKGQDKFLNENLFKNKKNGIFIEVGAHDGISFSNTYFFEKELGWRGICVEPNPNMFAKLTLNRDCICEQLCISDSIGKKDFLLCTGYMLEMYSGLLDNYDPRHLERIEQEIQQFGGEKIVISVDCLTLQELFDKHNITTIDLLSVDIEGGELAAMKSIDFDKMNIEVILIENNFNENYVKNYLETKNYALINHIGKDDIYIFARKKNETN